uniref:Uncharacterized protein n=1 Tax=Cajanus cajan TaxID=3821 RepID=A0A151TZZ6_CAJCA|nr:hypothetical protein KK1_005174 [Cajanus cajan]
MVRQHSKGKWTLAWDNGRRWGYMTTNLAESINSVLKKIRNLPICSMVMATYTRCNKFFVERGREVDAMINVVMCTRKLQVKLFKMHSQRQILIELSPLTDQALDF